MAVSLSLTPISVSIVQTILNGAEFINGHTAANAATLIGSMNRNWTLLAELGKNRDKRRALEREISKRLEAKVGRLRQLSIDRGYNKQLLAGAVTEVKILIEELGDNPQRFVIAVQNPENLLELLRPQIENRKKYIETAAEEFYEQLADAAVGEFKRLAPTSPQFQLGAILRIMSDLDTVLDVMTTTSKKINSVVELTIAARKQTSDIAHALASGDGIIIGSVPSVPKHNVMRGKYESLPLKFAHTYALLGPSGMGKSQIAYSWMKRSGAHLSIWIDAKTETSILQSYEEAYQTIYGTYDTQSNDTQKYARLFLNWLRLTDVKWIIVFDAVPRNASSSIQNLIPKPTLSGLVVVTSQDRNFGRERNVLRIEVRGLQPEEGVELMRFHCGSLIKVDNDSALHSLGELFSWNPLALVHVITGITLRNIRVEKYLEALLSSETPVHDFFADSDSLSEQNTLRNALDYNVSDIENSTLGPTASCVLKLLSLTGQTPVPVKWIISLCSNFCTSPAPTSARFEVEVRTSISILDSRFLLDFDRDMDTIRSHEYIRQVTREKWKRSHSWAIALSSYLQGIQQLWDDALQYTSVSLRTLKKVTSSFLEHIPLDPLFASTDSFAKVSLAFASALFDSGLVYESVAILDRATVAYSAFRPPEDTVILGIKSRRAKFNSDLHPEHAVIEFDCIIPAQVDALGLACRDTLTSFINRELACIFAGHAEEERLFLKKLYSLCVSVFGSKDLTTLKCLGAVVRAESDSHNYVSAIRQCRRLLRARRNVLGAYHRDTLDAAHNYAYILGEMGAYDKAICQYTDLLPLQIRVFGNGAPNVLLNRNNVAHYYGLLGKPELAVALLFDLVQDAVLYLGETHRDTFKFRHNLAHWSGVFFGPDKAVSMFGVLTQDRSRAFGPMDVDVLRTRNRYAFWVARSGDRAFAQRLFQTLHRDEERVLGTEHWQFRSTSIDMETFKLS